MSEKFEWYCLECKKYFSMEKIEDFKRCPSCGCTDFNMIIMTEKKV